MHILPGEKESISKICKAITKHKNFLLTTHQAPDGDGLGCELALLRILKKLRKKAVVVNEMLPSHVYGFLSGYSEVHIADTYNSEKITPEVAIILDCSSKERIGKVLQFIPQSCLIINIDHHAGNDLFGDINWVCKKHSSVGEMCFFIVENLGLLDKKTAECLYVSILTDTGSFRHNFNSDTISIVDRLLATGIHPEIIADNVYHNNSISALNLLGHALISIQYNPDLQVAWTILSRHIFEKTGATEQDTELVIDILRSVEKVDFVFLVKERKNEVKFSLRSKRKSFNVRKIAEHFGGGGHDNAAGFSIKDCTPAEAVERFLRYLRQEKFTRG